MHILRATPRLVILMLVVFVFHANAQKFAVDASAGYGAMRSGIGGNVTLGNILFLGYGSFNGESGPVGGFMYRYKMEEINDNQQMVPTAYVAWSIGVIGTISASRTRYVVPTFGSAYYRAESDKQGVIGNSLLCGYIYPMGGGLYFEGGVGYSWGSSKLFTGTGAEMEEKLSGVTFDVGIGIKLF